MKVARGGRGSFALGLGVLEKPRSVLVLTREIVVAVEAVLHTRFHECASEPRLETRSVLAANPRLHADYLSMLGGHVS